MINYMCNYNNNNDSDNDSNNNGTPRGAPPEDVARNNDRERVNYRRGEDALLSGKKSNNQRNSR